MSLRTIEAGLVARLETLLTTATPAGYVEAVASIAGEQDLAAKTEGAALVTNNLVTVAFDRRTVIETVNPRRGTAAQTLYSARWRISIVVRDLRAQASALTAENTGVYALMDAVTVALAGYKCPGLWRKARVEPINETRDIKHKPGRYIATLLFETRYAVQGVEPTMTTEEPLLIHGDVNLIPAADTAPNPMTEVEAP
jgi:hypothetical protein